MRTATVKVSELARAGDWAAARHIPLEKGSLYSLMDVAARLGVCSKTVRRQIDSRKLRAVRIGRRVLIEGADVERYIARLKRERG